MDDHSDRLVAAVADRYRIERELARADLALNAHRPAGALPLVAGNRG